MKSKTPKAKSNKERQEQRRLFWQRLRDAGIENPVAWLKDIADNDGTAVEVKKLYEQVTGVKIEVMEASIRAKQVGIRLTTQTSQKRKGKTRHYATSKIIDDERKRLFKLQRFYCEHHKKKISPDKCIDCWEKLDYSIKANLGHNRERCKEKNIK